MTKSIALVAVLVVAWLPAIAMAYLHPGLGSFVQRDPLGYIDGGSLYQYVGSNPITYADPTGLIDSDCHSGHSEGELKVT